MTDTTASPDSIPVDTVDDDLARVRGLLAAAVQDSLDPEFEVPAAFADKGYERLPYGGGLFGIRRDRYIYRPMRAWDAAQKFADELVERTGGGVFLLVHDVLATLQAVARSRPAEDEKPEEHGALMGEVFMRRVNEHWRAFLDGKPRGTAPRRRGRRTRRATRSTGRSRQPQRDPRADERAPPVLDRLAPAAQDGDALPAAPEHAPRAVRARAEVAREPGRPLAWPRGQVLVVHALVRPRRLGVGERRLGRPQRDLGVDPHDELG